MKLHTITVLVLGCLTVPGFAQLGQIAGLNSVLGKSSPTTYFLGSDYTIDELLRLFVNAMGYSIDYLFTKEIDVPIDEDVQFFCSNPDNPDQKQVLLGDTSQISIDTTKPTTFLIHGWIDNSNRTWMQDTARDHKKFRPGNICLVNWGRLANYEYSMSANFTRRVGDYLGKFITWLVYEQGADPKTITLVGHSLGSHVAAFAAKSFPGSLGHIIGLDAAGPLFTLPYDVGPKERLDKGDADFVQLMHTSSFTLGVPGSLGDVDFYPNGGIAPMNGCPLESSDPPDLIACSHLRATSFFRSSLNPANQYYGRPCDSYLSWMIPFKCTYNVPLNIFGYDVDKTLPGSYYFSTNMFFPYAQGRK